MSGQSKNSKGSTDGAKASEHRLLTVGERAAAVAARWQGDGRCVTRITRTTLQHDGPNHLGL